MIQDTYLDYLKRIQKFNVLKTEMQEIQNRIKEYEQTKKKALKDKLIANRKTQRKVKLCALCDEPAESLDGRYCSKHEEIFMNIQKNFKTEIANMKSIKKIKKEENYKLFQKGMKKCLVCGEESKSNGKLYSPCKNCRSKVWLVGDNYPCEICNRTAIKPVTHHIDGNRKNNIYENLIFLCMDCHTAIHLGVGLGNKKGKNKKRKTKNRLYSKDNQIVNILQEYSIKYREGIKNKGDIA